MEGIAAVFLGVAALVTAAGTLIVAIGNSRKATDAKVAAEAARTIAATEGAKAVAAAEAARLAAETSQRAIVETKDGVFELGKRVDGRLEELLAITRLSAKAEGRLEGQQASDLASRTLALQKAESEVPVATRTEREDKLK